MDAGPPAPESVRVMFRHEMSRFLRAVLDAVATLDHGIPVDAAGRPDAETIAAIAAVLGESVEDVAAALEGLKANHCLVESGLELDGIESVGWWTVHPQCLQEPLAERAGGGLPTGPTC